MRADAGFGPVLPCNCVQTMSGIASFLTSIDNEERKGARRDGKVVLRVISAMDGAARPSALPLLRVALGWTHKARAAGCRCC
jgi:hypothetical protein